MLDAGKEKILLIDSSKFGKIFDKYICDLERFDRIITDQNLSEEWKRRIEEAGIDCVLV